MGYPPFMETRTWLCLKMLKKHLFFPFFPPVDGHWTGKMPRNWGYPIFRQTKTCTLKQWDSAMGQFSNCKITPMDSPHKNQANPGIFMGLFQGFLSRQRTVRQSLWQEFQVLLWPQPGSIDLIQRIPGLNWVHVQPRSDRIEVTLVFLFIWSLPQKIMYIYIYYT